MNTTPTARPMLFNTEMVQAIMNGDKTMTRRLMNPQPEPNPNKPGTHWYACDIHRFMLEVEEQLQAQDPTWQGLAAAACTYGGKDDLLWVRETFQGPLVDEEHYAALSETPEKFQSPGYCSYKASGDSAEYFDLETEEIVYRWKPSIHMPRWANRTTLKITNVRVEQMQEITAADILAEGTPIPVHDRDAPREHLLSYWKALWDSTTTPENQWHQNPWVWVIEFEVIHKNVDEVLKCNSNAGAQ